jgi:hypothetical protein
MNVLILTPDAVGSTLLQRVLTIYMQFNQFDRPVINLHELTNGLDRYYSPEFNRELLGKKQWGYHQSLAEVVQLLSSVDHYKTSRLAQYHIHSRNDPIEQQVPFYQYLNDNFYIISCRRENLLEHALSWAINKVTRKLNVYNAEEKINTFVDLFKDKITVEPQVLVDQLEKYADYIAWCDQYFAVSSYFRYERDVPNIERYVLNLPVFAGRPNRITWNDTFGQEFADWNRCHYMGSDLGTLALQNVEKLRLIQRTPEPSTVDQVPGRLPAAAADLVLSNLPAAHQEFYAANKSQYEQACGAIADMRRLGILVGGIPIKKQTLREKQYLVRNFDQCVDVYNEWIIKHPKLGQALESDHLQLTMSQEQQQWHPGSLAPAIAQS